MAVNDRLSLQLANAATTEVCTKYHINNHPGKKLQAHIALSGKLEKDKKR